MKTQHVMFLLLLAGMHVGLFAQKAADYSGDKFIALIGKGIQSAELQELIKTYPFELANNQHYRSGKGVELIFKKEMLEEVHFYNTSIVYGDYNGILPNRLVWGMVSAEVVKVLGKPSLTYNSGYYEYTFGTHLLSCWFEGGKLNQVVIAAKEGQ